MRILLASLAGAALVALPSVASADTRVNGQGTYTDGRTFAVSATIYPDGTATGHATLINRSFSGDKGKGPYQSHIDISCGQRIDDHTVLLGGFATRTNDSNLQDAVYFSIQDNGSPGKNRDEISGAFFFDDNPATTGNPAACLLSTLADEPLNGPILRGNFTIRETN